MRTINEQQLVRYSVRRFVQIYIVSENEIFWKIVLFVVMALEVDGKTDGRTEILHIVNYKIWTI